MVWPFEGQANGFEQVSKSYRVGAEACDGKILPAGDAWQEVLKGDPAAGLYTADHLHPTPAGTYLAALVIVHGLADVPPKSVPSKLRLATGNVFAVPEKQAKALREAAGKVVEADRSERQP
jgi:hypothetical protein